MTSGGKRKNENEEEGKATIANSKKEEAEDSTKKEDNFEQNVPLYGTKEYWENRYKSHITKPSVSNDHPNQMKRQKTEDRETLPGHEWYFTYDELRPLLLPLVLGRDEANGSCSEDNEEEDEYIDLSYDDDEESAEKNELNYGEMEPKSTRGSEKKVLDNSSETKTENFRQSNDEKKDSDDNNHQSYDDDDNDNVDKTITTNKEPVCKESMNFSNGLNNNNIVNTNEMKKELENKNSPKRVLEIGCGDVPLGVDFCNDLLNMQIETGSSAKNIVSQIVCCDFSDTVIQMLKERQQLNLSNHKNDTATSNDKFHHKLTSHNPRNQDVDKKKERDLNGLDHYSTVCHGENNDDNDQNKLSLSPLFVEYIVADARNLPYQNDFFDVVIDKGTLDAMLSDKEQGISNCKAIVAEVARVLAIGGHFMLISHLNANSQSGLEWIDEVLVSGLRTGGRNKSKWMVECHSGDMNDTNDDNSIDTEEDISLAEEEEISIEEEENEAIEKEEEDNPSSNNGPGPAVYIICKLPLDSSMENKTCDENERMNNLIKKGENEKENSKAHESDDPPTIPLKFFTY